MKFEDVYKYDIFANEAGVVLEELNDSHAVMKLTVERRHLNAGNFAHGGVLFLMADMAMAAIANHCQPVSVSLQSDIKFISVAVEGDILSAEAFEILGRKSLYYSRATIKNQNGKIIATAEGMYHIKSNTTIGR